MQDRLVFAWQPAHVIPVVEINDTDWARLAADRLGQRVRRWRRLHRRTGRPVLGPSWRTSATVALAQPLIDACGTPLGRSLHLRLPPLRKARSCRHGGVVPNVLQLKRRRLRIGVGLFQYASGLWFFASASASGSVYGAPYFDRAGNVSFNLYKPGPGLQQVQRCNASTSTPKYASEHHAEFESRNGIGRMARPSGKGRGRGETYPRAPAFRTNGVPRTGERGGGGGVPSCALPRKRGGADGGEGRRRALCAPYLRAKGAAALNVGEGVGGRLTLVRLSRAMQGKGASACPLASGVGREERRVGVHTQFCTVEWRGKGGGRVVLDPVAEAKRACHRTQEDRPAPLPIPCIARRPRSRAVHQERGGRTRPPPLPFLSLAPYPRHPVRSRGKVAHEGTPPPSPPLPPYVPFALRSLPSPLSAPLIRTEGAHKGRPPPPSPSLLGPHPFAFARKEGTHEGTHPFPLGRPALFARKGGTRARRPLPPSPPAPPLPPWPRRAVRAEGGTRGWPPLGPTSYGRGRTACRPIAPGTPPSPAAPPHTRGTGPKKSIRHTGPTLPHLRGRGAHRVHAAPYVQNRGTPLPAPSYPRHPIRAERGNARVISRPTSFARKRGARGHAAPFAREEHEAKPCRAQQGRRVLCAPVFTAPAPRFRAP
ncbi:hypothetical protein EDB86DRAFT_2832991 [Lactarius hatsudake]|nr:hypothetical protein EDB86DRAFT_2832991 [Lactarius hatsudake]